MAHKHVGGWGGGLMPPRPLLPSPTPHPPTPTSSPPLCSGIVHRDLKLENLLLTRHGDISSVKLADFTLAKRFAGGPCSEAAEIFSTMCGSPSYVAPEVLKVGGEVGVGRGGEGGRRGGGAEGGGRS